MRPGFDAVCVALNLDPETATPDEVRASLEDAIKEAYDRGVEETDPEDAAPIVKTSAPRRAPTPRCTLDPCPLDRCSTHEAIQAERHLARVNIAAHR